MRGEIQEDTAELAIKWMLKVPKLSAELIVAGLKAIIKSITNKEPMGQQKIEKLMKDSKQKIETINLNSVGKDIKEFAKLARKYGVGFSVLKSSEGYTLFFRAERAKQMMECIAEYGKRKLDKPRKEGIHEKLDKAIKQTEEKRKEPTQDKTREHNKTHKRERGRV